jgi:hypothetical protein
MKRILLPFLLFATPSIACYIPMRTVPVQQQIMIRHPQANVNYVCQPGQPLEHCVDIACSYATQYSCRIISQTSNTYYIETYIPSNSVLVTVAPAPVIVTTPAVVYFPPIINLFPSSPQPRDNHRVYHRPRRR